MNALLNTGNLVRIKDEEGIWRISGISYEDGRGRNYYFIRERRIEGDHRLLSFGVGEIEGRIEKIRIVVEVLERNGFVYGFNNDGLGRWVKSGEDWSMEYDMEGRMFVISGKDGKICEGECEFVNEMQDMIKGTGYWGRVDIVIE